MELRDLVRPNIWALKPYSSARHEFKGHAEVMLDANENPIETGLNRYPDPLQLKLKGLIAKYKDISIDQIFLGNGSDEAIDLLIRIFCRPGQDSILITPPTYGMYRVSADINDVQVQEVLLDPSFELRPDEILSVAGPNTKLLFLCSPNNPTGNNLDRATVEYMIQRFTGIVVIDEAYFDFSNEQSWTTRLSEFDNLVVMQTFSKAWGLAGIRLGMAFASPEIIGLFNKVKPPYNVNKLTQNQAIQAFEGGLDKVTDAISMIVSERARVRKELQQLEETVKIFNSDSNFLLVRFKHPLEIFHTLREEGVVVRDRSSTPLCDGCLRITIGRPEENDRLLSLLKNMKF